jgi:hypothetical protein
VEWREEKRGGGGTHPHTHMLWDSAGQYAMVPVAPDRVVVSESSAMRSLAKAVSAAPLSGTFIVADAGTERSDVPLISLGSGT